MPIDFNPFAPVCNNLLIPLGKSLYQPYITLMDKSIRPLYHSVIQPCKNYEQAVIRCYALIKTLELVVQFSVYFFLYQKGWNCGVHYLGLAGGVVAFSLIYGAGCWVDDQLKTSMNAICTGTWLYYKGIRSLGTNREGMLASIVVGGYLNRQHQNSSTVNEWEVKRTHAAEWLAQLFFEKPPPLSSDGSGMESIDSR